MLFFARLFERVVYSQASLLLDFFFSLNQSPQSSFCLCHSSQTALANATDYFLVANPKGVFSVLTVLDFRQHLRTLTIPL